MTLRPLRVLILEDRPDDAELVVDQLHQAGFEPLWEVVANETDYVRALDERLDVILADYNLPQFDARRALQLLVERGVDVPFIIVSGTVDEDAAVAAMKAGASDYLKKGSLAHLGAAIERELKACAERRAAREDRHKREAALNQLAAIVESSDDAIYGVGLDWNILSWNGGAERLFGYAAEEAIGRSINMLYPPDRSDELASYKERVAAGAHIDASETVRLHKDGRRVDVSIAVSPITAATGELIAFSAIVRGIGERKRAEQALRASEERYRRIVETAFEGVWIIDADDKTTFVNRRMADMLGYTVDELLGKAVVDFMDDDAQATFAANWSRRRSGFQPQHDFKFTRKDGSELWAIVEANPTTDEAGGYAGSLAMVTDITARKQAEESLSEQTSLYEALVKAQSDLGEIVILTEGDRPIYLNDAFSRITGYTIEHLMQMGSLFELVPPDALDTLPSNLIERLHGEKTRAFETVIVARDGNRVYLEGTDMRFELGSRTLVFTVARDVTQRKQAQQALEHQTLHDALTGLPNRLLLRDSLQRSIDQARSAPVALLMIDLDHFKEVNDTFGHQVGDLLLQQVGPRLSAQLREGDLVARLGGDEFAVLLPAADQATATGLGGRLLEAFDRPFEVEGQLLDVAASIGVASFPQDGDDADVLLRLADIAMFVAKRSRGTVTTYAPEYDRQGASRLTLMAELRSAIQNDELVLHYQPIVSLRDRTVKRLETLVRWEHPKLGVIPPVEFIPFAEKTRLIRPLTDWVLRQAMRQCRAWYEAGHSLRVAVNVSMRDLLDPELPDRVSRVLHDVQADPAWLGLEITEGVIMADADRAIDTLHRLRKLRIHLAIDDFGTGYSSLAYLHRLPLDEIKIDKSFVMKMPGAGSNIVKAAVDLSHSLRLETVGEGVENTRTWDLLNALGCDAAQGFFIGRPMSAENVPAWLAAWSVHDGAESDPGEQPAA